MAIRAMGPSGQYETGLDAAGAALPELLAPAGGLDQMLAAIAAGADAIYAGLGGFNARVSAHGFTDDEFARGSAVDLDGSADRLSLCTASDPQG